MAAPRSLPEAPFLQPPASRGRLGWAFGVSSRFPVRSLLHRATTPSVSVVTFGGGGSGPRQRVSRDRMGLGVGPCTGKGRGGVPTRAPPPRLPLSWASPALGHAHGWGLSLRPPRAADPSDRCRVSERTSVMPKPPSELVTPPGPSAWDTGDIGPLGPDTVPGHPPGQQRVSGRLQAPGRASGRPPNPVRSGLGGAAPRHVWGAGHPASQHCALGPPCRLAPSPLFLSLLHLEPFSGPSEPLWTWGGRERPGQHLPPQTPMGSRGGQACWTWRAWHQAAGALGPQGRGGRGPTCRSGCL